MTMKPNAVIKGYVIRPRFEEDPIGGLFIVLLFKVHGELKELVQFLDMPNSFEMDPRSENFLKFKLTEEQKKFIERHQPGEMVFNWSVYIEQNADPMIL